MIHYLLIGLNNVGKRSNRRIGLALLLHMLLAYDKSVVLAVYHPVGSLKSTAVKEVGDIHLAVLSGNCSRLGDLERLKLNPVCGHKEHIRHTAYVGAVALCLLLRAGGINNAVKERVAEKTSRSKESVGKRCSETGTLLLEAAVILENFHS